MFLALLYLFLNLQQETAFSYLEKVVSFGQRIPGTTPHKNCKDFIINVLKEKEYKVNLQSFKEMGVEFTNIIGSYGNNPRKILLGTHYDTKPGIPGANDGGSGTALLLALLDTLKTFHFSFEIIFFDGEDFGQSAALLGSKYFAQKLKDTSPYIIGIILDMIGDKDLQVFMEKNSLIYAEEYTKKLFNIARKLNAKSFFSYSGYEILDDHIPLNEKGIPTILLIDFDYPYWHTDEDTIDKCSEESFEEIARVLLTFLRSLEKELKSLNRELKSLNRELKSLDRELKSLDREQ